LSDLSLAHVREHTSLEVLEQGAHETADQRARALITRHTGRTQDRIRGIEQIFALLAAELPELRNPAMDSVRQELNLFRRQDPPPELRTAMILFAHLRIQHDDIGGYADLADRAVLLGRMEASCILTALAKQAEEAAAEIERLVPELLSEMAGGVDVTA
jgi:ferritin-like metal-binding protein YciE